MQSLFDLLEFRRHFLVIADSLENRAHGEKYSFLASFPLRCINGTGRLPIQPMRTRSEAC